MTQFVFALSLNVFYFLLLHTRIHLFYDEHVFHICIKIDFDIFWGKKVKKCQADTTTSSSAAATTTNYNYNKHQAENNNIQQDYIIKVPLQTLMAVCQSHDSVKVSKSLKTSDIFKI